MSFILPLNPVVHVGESDLPVSWKKQGVTERKVSFKSFLFILQVFLPHNSSIATESMLPSVCSVIDHR